MPTPIRIKRRLYPGAAGAPSSLYNAELAFNENDKILYYGYGIGVGTTIATSIISIAGEGAFVTLSTGQTISGIKTFTNPIIGSFSNSLNIGAGLSQSGSTYDGSSSRTISLPLIGTSGTYGSTTAIPVITTDSYGRITGVTTSAISTTLNLIGNSGSGSVSNGGTLGISGGTGITTNISSNNVTVNIDNSVVTLSGVQTLTNKTFDTASIGNILRINGNLVNGYTGTGNSIVLSNSPVLISPTIGSAFVDSITASSSNIYLYGAGSSGNVVLIPSGSGVIDTSGFKISNVGTPLNSTDAVNKIYVDNLVSSAYTAGAGLSQTGTTFNVIGTLDRITVNADSVDIAATYAGQNSITTLGTITTGTWNADTISISKGGTGLVSTPTNGQLLIGNGTGYSLNTLGVGSGITISNSSGGISINNTGVLSLNVSGNGISIDGSTGSLTISTGATSANTNSSIVYRDSSGNFSAGTITASLSGNASTATTLQTTRNINGVSFNGSSDITITANTPNIITFDNSGSGAGSGTTFNGAIAQIISYNTIGASPLAGSSSLTTTGTITSGTWSASFGTGTTFNAANLVGTLSSTVLSNSTLFVGTTSIALNRTSANQGLTGISSIQFPGASSGTITLQPTATAGSNIITLPASTGTIALTSDIPIVNNGTLTLAVSGTGLTGSATFTANQSGNATFMVASNATNLNTASTIVARDASGNFSAGTISASSLSLINPLTVVNGGTGLSTAPANGRLLIGNGTNYTLSNLGVGTGITVANGAGTITITNTGVTSLGVSGNGISINGSTGALTVSTGATSANTASSIVFRDVSGNFSAGTITANSSVYSTVYDFTQSTLTTISTGQTTLSSVGSSTYRSAEYIVQAVQGTNYHTTKILLVHDGTNAYITEYGSIVVGSTVATFDADINTGNIRLLAIPASASSTKFQVAITAIRI